MLSAYARGGSLLPRGDGRSTLALTLTLALALALTLALTPTPTLALTLTLTLALTLTSPAAMGRSARYTSPCMPSLW